MAGWHERIIEKLPEGMTEQNELLLRQVGEATPFWGLISGG
jgi:hypothetical protein